MLSCQELAERIEELQPDASSRAVARLCLLLSNWVENTEVLRDRQTLTDAWQQMNLKLQAAADQHAAMTDELDRLAKSDPEKFTPDQVWVLVRAIKVQSQVLSMYLGQTAVDV